MTRSRVSILLLLGLAALLPGCVTPTPTVNPSFNVSAEQADVALTILKENPKPLERPLVVLGGFLDVGFGPLYYSRAVDKCVDGKIIRITFATCTSLPQCREKLIAALDRELGNASDTETVEVDVIGQSLGGLIAIYSAMEDPRFAKRLKIRRLFTISSPLQGAKMATWTPFNVFGFQADMRPGSDLYVKLAKAKFDFPIYSYTRLDDGTVGERYAALPGHHAWWVDNPPFERAHVGVFSDKRVLLDIVRRLRGEKPIGTEPPAPLPFENRE